MGLAASRLPVASSLVFAMATSLTQDLQVPQDDLLPIRLFIPPSASINQCSGINRKAYFKIILNTDY
jgi:hypothetical protein